MDYPIEKTVNDLGYFTAEAKKIANTLTGVSRNGLGVILHFSGEASQTVLNQITAIVEPTTPPMDKLIRDRLRLFRTKSVDLVDTIMVENTLSGMTDAQSAYLFKKINPAIDAIQLGALPTAKRILQDEITDFIFTQAKKDRYVQLVEEAMNG